MLLKRYIISLGYTILDEDKETSLLVGLGDGSYAASYIEDNGRFISFETSVVFDYDVAHMMTLSSISHVASYYNISCTGIIHKKDEKIKVTLSKKIGFLDSLSLVYILPDMANCIEAVTGYITSCMSNNDTTNWDLSMFQNIDLYLFNPKRVGEKKSIIYGSWDKFIDSFGQKAPDAIYGVEPVLEEVRACKEFEEKNRMLISEVGDRVLEELIWSRKMTEYSQDDEFGVN